MLFILWMPMFFTSCESFFEKKLHADDILLEEEKAIRWNEVDTFPMFENCDELTSKDEQRACFEQVVGNRLSAKITSEFKHYASFSDTLYLHFLISDSGEIVLEKIENRRENKLLDSLIRQAVRELPKLFPAQKRNIPVACRLNLPLVVHFQ